MEKINPKLTDLSDEEFSALCDQKAEKCKKFSKELAIALKDAAAYTKAFINTNKCSGSDLEYCKGIELEYERGITILYPLISYKRSKKSIYKCGDFNNTLAKDRKGEKCYCDFFENIKAYNATCLGILEEYCKANLEYRAIIKELADGNNEKCTK